MPRGRPNPLTPVPLRTLTERLRSIHRAAEDPNEELFPDPDDPYGWLQYATRHSSALPNIARQESGKTCILLARHLHPRLDAFELAAIKIARGGGAIWDDLVDTMGVASKGSAVKRAQRLEVEMIREPDELRAPETLRERRRTEAAELEVLQQTLDAARGLLAYAPDLCRDDSIDDDLAYLEALLDPKTKTQRVALGAALREIVRDIRKLAEETGQSAGRTPQALRALESAERTRPDSSLTPKKGNLIAKAT